MILKLIRVKLYVERNKINFSVDTAKTLHIKMSINATTKAFIDIIKAINKSFPTSGEK